MGLFDFARDIGSSMFSSDEEAPAKLQEHIEANNPGITDLSIRVDDGVATIGGEVDSIEALEKTILMTGNTKGIGEVKIGEVITAGPLPEEWYIEGANGVDGMAGDSGTEPLSVQYYEIEKGDSLWKIATRFYGDGNKHNDLFEANREVIRDPDLIFVGQKIRIPSL